jgi:hypothetical protein
MNWRNSSKAGHVSRLHQFCSANPQFFALREASGHLVTWCDSQGHGSGPRGPDLSHTSARFSTYVYRTSVPAARKAYHDNRKKSQHRGEDLPSAFPILAATAGPFVGQARHLQTKPPKVGSTHPGEAFLLPPLARQPQTIRQ